MSRLSIIITHHTEPIELIKPLFQSLDLQLAINWEDIDIILCDNTGKWFDYTFINDLKNIKNRIKYLNDPNYLTAGLNRQQGINFCNSDYFMFCDCDDRLYSCIAIKEVMDATYQYPDADIIQYSTCINNSNTFEENSLFRDGLVGGSTWGTIIKKEFYTKNNIQNISNIVDEDMYINKIIRCINNKNVVSIPNRIYVWCQRNNSLSHLSQINDSVEKYIIQTVSKLNTIENIYNYCSQHSNITTFDEKIELWNELPYFYWIQQWYENEVGANNINIDIEQEMNEKIVNVYKSITSNEFFDKYLYEYEYKNLSTVGKTETLQEWVKRIFKLEN